MKHSENADGRELLGKSTRSVTQENKPPYLLKWYKDVLFDGSTVYFYAV